MPSPSGQLSGPVDALRTLIATSTTFRTWTSTANATVGKERVYTPSTITIFRPFALIRGISGRVKRGGYVSGVMEFFFESRVSEQFSSGLRNDEDMEAFYEHANNVGVILGEMMEQTETAGYLFAPDRGIDFTMPQRASVKDEVDVYQTFCRIPFGLDSNP